MVQLGVFLVPPADNPFYRVVTGILGYDVWTGERRPSTLTGLLDDATLTRWIGEATKYGLHCTITGGAIDYDEADIGEITERLAWIASRVPPFTLTAGRFYDEFWAVPVGLTGHFESADGGIHRLHRLAATTISPLHTATYCGRPRDPNDARARELFTRFGEAHALERFTPHWTLMSGLPDMDAYSAARDLIAEHTGLFSDDSTRTIEVRDVQLVQRHADGYCFVAASFPLTGRA
ncbi:MAG: hypothetical protein AB7K36_12985 [Chloroflexota bacterium]